MMRQIIAVALEGAYLLINLVLAIFSIHLLILILLSFVRSDRNRPVPGNLHQYPRVLVQLPIYNERYVVCRLIDSVVRLDYPRDKLLIQVIDDSNDDTSRLAKERVDYYRSLGISIEYLRRSSRDGYKAGALAYGLTQDESSEFIAVFDADFVPSSDFLLRTIPYFIGNPQIGAVQGRWEHLNRNQNWMTRTISLGLDMHFAIDQMARSSNDLMRNVNGSGCVFRRQAIIDAGGWQSDTLVEDTDLSYRMQLHNWEIIYDSDVVIPGEVPFNIPIFKKQQYRWAKGLIQTFKKLIGPIWQSNKRFTQKLAATAHLSMYSGGFLILLVYLLTLPLIMIKGRLPAQLAIFGFSSFIPPISILVSQICLRRNWLEGILLYPILSLISIGISLELTRAFWEAVTGKATPFNRTPKVSLNEGSIENYSVDLDWTTWGELILSLYGIFAAILVFHKFPAAVPLFIIYSLAFLMNAFSEMYYALRKRAKVYQVV